MISQNNSLIRAKKTLEIIANTLSRVDFAVVGSYANFMILGDESKKQFTSNSDLDIAVRKYDHKELQKALDFLKDTNYFNQIIKSRGYNWVAGVKFPGYLLRSHELTPVHLVGTLVDKKNAVRIDGVDYILGHY